MLECSQSQGLASKVSAWRRLHTEARIRIRPSAASSAGFWSLSSSRVSASRSAGDTCITEVRPMGLVCHDLEWLAHRACHEKATECVTKSRAAPTAGAAVCRCSPPFERVMQELVQGPRRLIRAPPGPSESESRETNAFAPTASVQASREPWARAVGDELRRIVVLPMQKRARSPYHDVRGVAAGRCVLADRTWIPH